MSIGTSEGRPQDLGEWPWPRLVRELAETQRVEYKEGEVLKQKHQVVRACLALANEYDGGYVVIGVEDKGGGYEAVGLTEGQVSHLRADQLARDLRSCGCPPLDVRVTIEEDHGLRFALIEVRGLPVPVVSTFSGGPESDPSVRPGVIYVRRGPASEPVNAAEYSELLKRRDETTRVQTMNEMKEAGLLGDAQQPPTDRDKFEQEARDIDGT